MSILINGRIPPNTECPYRNRCSVAKNNDCNHKGIEHLIPFSCAIARLFVIMDRGKLQGGE
jgi:hypothetical protein